MGIVVNIPTIPPKYEYALYHLELDRVNIYKATLSQVIAIPSEICGYIRPKPCQARYVGLQRTLIRPIKKIAKIDATATGSAFSHNPQLLILLYIIHTIICLNKQQ